MRSVVCLLALLVTAANGFAAERQAISPPGVKPIGPYSPGILAGDSLYVSGQGAKRADGTFPETPAAQFQQCMTNIRAVVEAAGLTMDHLVYAQVYVRDAAAFPEIAGAWDSEFPNNGPARSMIGVARLPDNTPVEVNAVAIRDVSGKSPIRIKRSAGASVPDAVVAGERVYVSDCVGRDNAGQVPSDPREQARLALERMGAVLRAAGLDHRHMVFVNPYMTANIGYGEMNSVYAKYFEFGNTPARATIEVASLPGNANIQFTGVAVRDLARRKAVRPKNMPPSPTASPCVFAADVFYCSAKSGFIPGPNSGVFADTVEKQVRQTMRNLLDGLDEAGLNLSGVVAANVYLDDVADFPKMNRIYKLFFGDVPPARTTVQQRPPVTRAANEKEEWPTLEQISLIAVK